MTKSEMIRARVEPHPAEQAARSVSPIEGGAVA